MAFDQGSSAGNDSISQINVTPLVDVMLVLLIIFMVTAPILQQGVASTCRRSPPAPLAGEEEQLVVNVAKGGQVFLNDTRDDARATHGEARGDRAAARPDRQLYVRADQSVPYGQVMQVDGGGARRRARAGRARHRAAARASR